MTQRRVPGLAVASVLMLGAAAVAGAQETPTEREAAKGVLASMAAMQRGLDVPGMVAKFTASTRPATASLPGSSSC